MAKKISQLTELGTLSGNEVVPVSINGQSYKVKLSDLKVLFPDITLTDLGLSNVDNTSDANKPVSSQTQQALSGKAASVHAHAVQDVTGLNDILDDKAHVNHGHTLLNIEGLELALGEKASSNHTHTGYVTFTDLQAAIRAIVGSDGVLNVQDITDYVAPSVELTVSDW